MWRKSAVKSGTGSRHFKYIDDWGHGAAAVVVLVVHLVHVPHVNRSNPVPWSSLAVGDEGCIGQSGKLFCKCQNIMQHMHGIGTYLTVGLILLSSKELDARPLKVSPFSIADRIIMKDRSDRRGRHKQTITT